MHLLEVGEVGRAVSDVLKVVDGEGNVGGTRHGEEVQDLRQR